MGVKLANPELDVIAVGGDGDGFAIGGGHFPHAARRNVDITYIIMNNQTYGLTKGQVSPTSLHDQKSPSTPFGNLEEPMNVLATAIAADCSYVAQGASFRSKELTELIVEGIRHPGFSFIDAFSPCTAFNNTTQEWKEAVYNLPAEHDSSDRAGGVRGRARRPDGHRHLLPRASARRSTAACARCRMRSPTGFGRRADRRLRGRAARARRGPLAQPSAQLLLERTSGVRVTRAMKLPFAGPLPSNDSAIALPSMPGGDPVARGCRCRRARRVTFQLEGARAARPAAGPTVQVFVSAEVELCGGSLTIQTGRSGSASVASSRRW